MFNYSSSQKLFMPIALLVMIVLGVVLRLLLKNKSEKVKNIPLTIIAFMLLGLEIGKQIYYLFFVEYITYALPFHFCTLVIFVIILTQVFGKKLNAFFKPIAFSFSGLATFMLYIAPTSLIGNSLDNLFLNYYTFHTCAFHHLLVLYFILTISLGTYQPKLTDCFKNVGGIIFYGLYATPIAFALNTNYVNILKSTIGILENIRLSCGQFVYDAIWFLFCSACSALICVAYYYLLKLITFIKSKIKS